MGTTTFLSKKAIEKTIEGERLRFFPVRVSVLFELRSIIKPMLTAVATLWSLARSGSVAGGDLGKTYRDMETKAEKINETIFQPITPELALARQKQQDKAISDMVDALTAPENTAAVGRLITDSLREKFKGRLEPSELTEFMTGVDLPALIALLEGVYEANKEVLVPLMDRLPAPAKEAIKDGLKILPPETSETTATG